MSRMDNQQAINLLKDLEKNLDDYCGLNDEGKTAFGMAITALELFGNSEQFPSAQPEQHLDEWCVDCKEYDKEKHSCPRWNRVIRQTLLDAQPEHKTGYWILDRSGAYCCSKCMEPCATYAMMKPRDKFCKMCGSRNEVME